MWPYYPELLAMPVPRYTSFPTAAEFGDAVGAGDFSRALEDATGDVSLYIHIPFCETICWYCGCNTSRSNRLERVAAYLDSLHQEVALVGEHLPQTARVRRIAFGGGSPNAIAPVDFVRLMDALTLHFPLANPVLSVELDPRGLGEEWVSVLSGIGVQRASLGVQTFSPSLQKAIGRVQPRDLIARTTETLRRAGISSLNFDLMYGLPGQTQQDLDDALGSAVALGADRIAFFGYAHVPHLIARQKRIDASALPDQQERFKMAARGYSTLVGEGYTPVGFDHFAKPGDPLGESVHKGTLRRNFQGFTDDRADVLIGLGASAISSFPSALVQNEKNTGRYRTLLSQARYSGSLGVRRSPEDRMRGAMIEGLLCQGRARIAPQFTQEAKVRLAPFMERGLVSMNREMCSIAPEGLPYARSIAAQFDPYRQDSLRRFSSAV